MWQGLDSKLCTIVPALLEYWLGRHSGELSVPVFGFSQSAVDKTMQEYLSAKADSGSRIE